MRASSNRIRGSRIGSHIAQEAGLLGVGSITTGSGSKGSGTSSHSSSSGPPDPRRARQNSNRSRRYGRGRCGPRG